MLADTIGQDIRYAIRSYAKSPSFTTAALLTLALGIGASTAIFSMVNGIVLRPLAFRDPDRLVFVSEVNADGLDMSISWLNYLDWRARTRAFETLASSRNEQFMLTGVERPERLAARRVTFNFFPTLGVSPAMGRGFTEADDRAGAERVTVISDDFWRSRLGSRADVIGTHLLLDGGAYTVVGVLPPGFRYVRPCALFVAIGPAADVLYARNRGDHAGHFAVGRLKRGVTADAAARDLQAIELSLQREHPDTNAGVTVHLEPLAARIVSGVRATLLVLLGAVGCLLLIACANVASLLVARGAARQHELAIRSALGGGRGRLAVQLLVESTLLSAVGGIAGVALAAWLLRLLVAVAPEGMPRLDEVVLDRTALAFAGAAIAACGILFGAFPAFQASTIDGQQVVVRGRSAGAAAGSHRLRRGLMVVEIAVALVLLTGAGLMIRTLRELALVDTGFRADHLLTLRVSLPGERWSVDRRIAFIADLRARITALPGVRDAGLVSALPIDGSDWNSIFIAANKPIPERTQLPSAAITLVTPGYFEAMQTRLLRGRLLTAADTRSAPRVVVVNEALARRIWPGENPLGQRLKRGWPEQPEAWREVVGVVSDVKFEGVADPTPLQIYLPLAQELTRDLAVVVRSDRPADALRADVEAAIHAIDPDLAVYSVRTMERIVEESIARERMAMVVLVVFAIVALTLASIGLYGVVAHAVTERTHEIGVRMALGADERRVVLMIVGQGLSMAAVGTAAGVAGAVALSRSIQALLFHVTPSDPATIVFVVALLLVVTLVACLVPARRATRLDPTVALRAE